MLTASKLQSVLNSIENETEVRSLSTKHLVDRVTEILHNSGYDKRYKFFITAASTPISSFICEYGSSRLYAEFHSNENKWYVENASR